MERTGIDRRRLAALWSHSRRINSWNALRGLPYERCAELPWILGYLTPRFQEQLRYLDVGSGLSLLPTFLLGQTRWDITCADKFQWVEAQGEYLTRLKVSAAEAARFHVVKEDFIKSTLAPGTFDVVTSISVIEHMESQLDSRAMERMGQLLKPGGVLVLSTLMNEDHFREFFLEKAVYGVEFKGRPVFYQRHYDTDSLEKRVVAPSGLGEVYRVYFGDFAYPCFQRLYCGVPRIVRGLYQWATPWIASRFLSYSETPLSRKEMTMNTSSGVILVLEKPAAGAGYGART